MAVTAGIYEILCRASGRSYFGASVDIEKRLNQHLRMLKRSTHHAAPLQAAWTTYGESQFTFKTLAVLEPKELLSTEQRLLDASFLSANRPYNCSRDAAAPMKGRQHSQETKERMSTARTGDSNAFFGKVHSSETKLKIAGSKQGTVPLNKGKPMAEAVKEKISAAKKGKPSARQYTTKAVCRNGHLKDAENAYMYKGRHNCKICRNAASVRHLSKLKGE